MATTRRSEKYSITWAKNTCDVSKAIWEQYVAQRLIRPVGERVARVCRGVVATLRKGKLLLERVIHVGTVSGRVDNEWLYHDAPLWLSKPSDKDLIEIRRKLQRERDDEIFLEAKIWRLKMGGKLKNSISSMSDKQKLAVLVAFGRACWLPGFGENPEAVLVNAGELATI